MLFGFNHSCNVHCGGVAVIARLSHVAVVIGVHQLAPLVSSQDFNSSVGNHFIAVHIALGTGASLPHDQREVVAQLTLSHFI